MHFRWDDMRVLLAIHRTGSLKAAASQLDINISTVARRLDSLEAALALRLFDRSGDGTHPTAAAEELVPFAETMERSALELAHTLDGMELEPAGVVRIAAPPGLATHFIAPLLHKLLGRHPKLTVELIASVGYADLTRREADIALRAARPTAGDLLAKRLGAAPSIVIASAVYVAEQRRLANLSDIAWVTYGEDLGHLPETSWIVDQVPASAIALRSNSLTAQLAAVASGLGATLASRPTAILPGLAELPLAAKLARKVLPFPESSLWLVGHRSLREVPRVAATWTFFEEEFHRIIT